MAVAAAIGYVTVKTIEARNAQADFNRVLKEAPLDEVNAKIEELRQKLDKVKVSSAGAAGGMSMFGGQAGVAALRVAELNTQLAQLEQRQAILSKTYTIAGIEYDSNMVPINPPATVSDQRASAANSYVPPVSSGGGGGGAGGRSAADILKEQMDAGKELMQQLEREAALRSVGNSQARALLEIEYEKQDLLKQINETAAESQKAKLEELATNAALEKSDEIRAEYAKQKMEAMNGVLQPLQDELELLEAKLNGNEEEIKQLQQIEALAKSIALARDPENGTVTAGDRSQASGLVTRKKELEDLVAKQQELKDMAMNVAGSISGAFGQAFKDIITGSKSAQEALSNAFQKIGEAFLDMAMQIIQKQLTMIVYGMIMKALGVSMPGAQASGGLSGGSSPFASGFGDMSIAGPSAFSGGMIPGYANGGTLLAGQTALVGERGPELVTPSQTMNVRSNETMGSYMPSNSTTSSMANAPINMTYSGPTLNFNGDDYIPRSEAPQLVAQGAKMGEMRTMASLKNNRSSRNRIGL